MKLYRAGESRRRDWQLINRRQETRLGRELARGFGPDQADQLMCCVFSRSSVGGTGCQCSNHCCSLEYILWTVSNVLLNVRKATKLHNTQHSYCVIFFVKIFICLWVSLKILQAKFRLLFRIKVLAVLAVLPGLAVSLSHSQPLSSHTHTQSVSCQQSCCHVITKWQKVNRGPSERNFPEICSIRPPWTYLPLFW